MFQLSALNETSKGVEHVDKAVKHTKEAEEAHSFKLYNQALGLQQNNRRDEAVQVYEELLQTPLIIESATTLVNEHNEAIEHPLKDPGLILKYSAHKNVASICASQGNINKAMENYLQAVMLDTSDVTLWYKIGILAAKLSNLHLSRRALTQGLECNSNHWPCLDGVITVCYAILDYENCLHWISRALHKDPYHKKGIYLRRKMISECPHLKKDFDHLFQNCGKAAFEMEISDEEASEFLTEALTLRENNRKLCIPPEMPVIPLKVPLKSLTFLNLGKSLIATYEYIETQEEPISVTSKINMNVFEDPKSCTKEKVNAEGTRAEESSVGADLASKMESGSEHAGIETPSKDVDVSISVNATTSGTASASAAIDVGSGLVSGTGSNDPTCSSNLPQDDALMGPPTLASDVNNSQKKAAKRKRVPDKNTEQSRRSERRSSRMKQRTQSRTESEPCMSPELDLRRNLLELLPKTLQLSQPVPMDLDSDTNSQDSALCPVSDAASTTRSNDGHDITDDSVTVSSFSTNLALGLPEKSEIKDLATSSQTSVDEASKLNSDNSNSIAGSVSNVTEENLVKNVNLSEADTVTVCDPDLATSPAPKKSKIETDTQLENSARTHRSPNASDLENEAEYKAPGTAAVTPMESSEKSNLVLESQPQEIGQNSGRMQQSPGPTGFQSEITNSADSKKTDRATVAPMGNSEESDQILESQPKVIKINAVSSEGSGPEDRSTADNMKETNSTIINPVPVPKQIEEKSSEEPNEESLEVRKFIDTYNDKQGGILNLLQLYCKWMGRRSHLEWEPGLKDVFLKAYIITRPTMKLESFTANNLSNENKIQFAFYILTHFECALDKKYQKHSVDFSYTPTELEYSDLSYIVDASFHPEIFEEDSMPEYRFKNFILRFHWVRATYFYLCGSRESTFGELTVCSKLCFEDVEIPLHYLENNNKITRLLINKRLDSLKRFQILEEAESLFAQERYMDLIQLIAPGSDKGSDDLTKKFSESGIDVDTRERPKLLDYLLKAVIALKVPVAILKRLGDVLDEALHSVFHLRKHKHGKDSKIYAIALEKWTSLINQCGEHLSQCFHDNLENLGLLEKDTMVKLTNSFVSLIHLKLQNIPTKSQFALKPGVANNFLKPWILLFEITKFDEDRTRKLTEHQYTEHLPSSLKILITAHEWLGEKGLCCIGNGALLRCLLKHLLQHRDDAKKTAVNIENMPIPSEIRSPSPQDKLYLRSNIEQCFYCLYGYPNKISRTSILVDHSSQQCTLAWADARLLYNYFKPEVLPGFDSYKINTILGDTAALLTRVVKLVPETIMIKLNSSVVILEEFLGGNDAEKELIVPDICSDENFEVMKDAYYFLADYYFKNKEMVQAGKHYMYDLCFNHERFDSWAGLALVKSSIIDEKLRLSVSKTYSKEKGVLELSIVALLCFQKAMNIEKVSTTLWIEYGSLAYWVHSFYSRQRRMGQSDDVVFLDKQKDLLLTLAEKCFNSALRCDPDDVNNEEWLIQYMLGKILEKRHKPPQTYLTKFAKSAGLLHRKHAKYPKKIQFKSYQSDYAIESLEMYFRLHASMLKLAQNEVNVLDGVQTSERPPLTKQDYDLFDDLIEEAQEGNFVKRESLPYSQLYEKSSDGQIKKRTTPGKLVVPGVEKQSGLTMGSLVPDAIASTITVQLSTESSTMDETSNGLEDDKMDTDVEIAEINWKCPEEVVCNTPKLNVDTIPLSDEKRLERALRVIKSCTCALHLCLGRLPQHYKSIYRLADLYWRCSKSRRHVAWSRDLLLSSESPWQQLSHMPAQGLLSERNKTNLFNGVWKIPVDEIDRPGSFACHLYRCILLILDVLLELKDHSKLLYLHHMLSKNPDQGRKYLQDSDRIQASQKALSYSVKALHSKVAEFNPKNMTDIILSPYYNDILTAEIRSEKSSEALGYVLDAGKLYQQKQRVGIFGSDVGDETGRLNETHKVLLLVAFQKYLNTCPEANVLFSNYELLPNAMKIDRIVKFCQQQSVLSKSNLATSSQNATTPARSESKSVSVIKKADIERKVLATKDKTTSPGVWGESASAKLQKIATMGSSMESPSLKGAKNSSFSPVSGLMPPKSPASEPLDLSTNTKVGANVVPSPAFDAFSRLYAAVNPSSGQNLTEKSSGQIEASAPVVPGNDSHHDAFTPSPTDKRIATQTQTVVETISVDDEGPSRNSSPILRVTPQTSSSPSDRPAKIKTVIQGSKTYTKIIPSKPVSKLSLSPRSAFTPTKSPLRQSPLKQSPQLEKLKKSSRAPLGRSASLPESSNPPGHKTLHRTGSVSDYTKQKLKKSILSRTSASLVRKPSITEQEINQILADPESSQSEDEEETESTFKPLDVAEGTDIASTSKEINVPVALTPIALSFTMEDEAT